MSAACGQSGNHAPHTYVSGWTWREIPGKPGQKEQVDVKVACNGSDPNARGE